MVHNASEHRGIPLETLLKYYIEILNFALLKNIAKVICLKAVCNTDAKLARQATNTTLRAVNELVLIMSEDLTCLHIIFFQACGYILYKCVSI